MRPRAADAREGSAERVHSRTAQNEIRVALEAVGCELEGSLWRRNYVCATRERRKDSSANAGAAIGPSSFSSNNSLGCAARAGAALPNNGALSVPASGYWHAQKQLWHPLVSYSHTLQST